MGRGNEKVSEEMDGRTLKKSKKTNIGKEYQRKEANSVSPDFCHEIFI